MDPYQFSAATYKSRVFSGDGALRHLGPQLERLNVQRPLVLCSPSVASHRSLMEHFLSPARGPRLQIFDGLQRNATQDSVLAAVAKARSCEADGLVAVGGGSVVAAARVVAILMAETSRPPAELCTQYPPGLPAVSPKLLAPKVPIVNVLTVATTAQNRAGSAMLDTATGRRLEFFDPKTRPAAVFWDSDALSTAPAALAAASGLAIAWSSLMARGDASQRNVLSRGDRLAAFALASEALPLLATSPSPDPRIAMCTAAFLYNRIEDAGDMPVAEQWVSRVCYSLGHAIYGTRPHVDPGLVYLALTNAAIRHFAERDALWSAGIAKAIGVPATASPEALGAAVTDYFARQGFAYRLRDLGISRDDLPGILEHMPSNFNADRANDMLQERGKLATVLGDAW